MKKLLLLFTIVTLFACNNAQKYLSRGNYDGAIRSASKKLRKKPNDPNFLNIIEQAYNKGNARDNEKINYLKKEGSPSSWDQLLGIFSNMKRRQDMVKLLAITPSNISYVNYDNEIINAKRKAAEYFFAHGNKMLAKNDRYSGREAYNDFLKVKRYYPDYPDVDKKIGEANFLGTNNVLFRIQNKANIIMPKTFDRELKKIAISELNSKWINYYNTEQDGLFYDYTILVNLKLIAVSPEGIKEIHFYEEKKMKDGFEYLLDTNGNVRKDTAGNDLKIDKFTNIRADLVEIQQHKTARIAGSLDYLDNRTKELIKTQDLTANSGFDYSTLQATGDLRALKPVTKKKLGNKPRPFPTDPNLLMQCGIIIKDMAKNYIFQNKSVIK